MTDSPEEIHGDERRRLVKEEVQKQVEPLKKAVEEVKGQNAQQSNLLAMQVRKIDDIGSRLKGLWGNGTGPPGYLENARAEDKEWKAQMFEAVEELRAERLREEGRADLRRAMEEQCKEEDRIADVKKTNRLARFHYWWVILGSFAGTWLLHLVTPVLHAFMDLVVKAMK